MSARLRAWFRGVPVVTSEEASDGDLVRRFAEVRDDGAFAELVRRHGPMVLATCRRVLYPDAHTADDAFQATFLVLATRAAAVSPPGRVGAWLHGVAVLVAKKAKAWVRRLVPMAPADVDRVPATPTETDPDAADVRAQIDDVLAGLPSKYRAAVVLCDLEQRSRKEVASGLGWSEGTLSSRLARARKLLADRLSRRGVSVPAAGLGVLLPASAATASVSAQLAASTTRNAALVAAGTTAGDTVPASVVTLARGVSMHTTGFKPLAAGLAFAALALGGLALYALTPPADTPPPDKTTFVAAPVPKATANTWTASRTFRHDAAVNAVAVAGDRVAAGDELGHLRLWDAKASGHQLLCETASFVGAKKPVPIHLVQFAPDAKGVYFTLADGTSINLCTLDADGKKGRVFPGTVQLTAANPEALTRDGKYWLETVDLFNPDRTEIRLEPNLLAAFDDKLVGKPEVVLDHAGRVTLADAPDADLIVTLSVAGELRRWKKGEKTSAWEQKLDWGKWERPINLALAACPVGKRVAVGDGSGDVRLYAADTGKFLLTLKGHAGVVRAVAFSADGRLVATGGADKTVRVWDAATGKQVALLEGHTGPVTAVAFAPDGATIATGGEDKTVRVWAHRREAAPVPTDDRMNALFGSVTDLDAKRTYKMTPAGVLTITVPPTVPAVELPADAAGLTRDSFVLPHLAKAVRGDFELTVRVALAVPESAGKAAGASLPKVYAGVAFSNGAAAPTEATFVYGRSKGADGWRPFSTMPYRHPNASGISVPTTLEKDQVGADGTVYMRVTRKGEMVTMQTSPDGKRWNSHGIHTMKGLGAAVYVGPVAFHCTDAEFTATFSEYQIKHPKDDEKKPAVRKLDLTGEHFEPFAGGVPKLIEVKSADELAKAKVFRDDEARATAKKQIDFAKEKLVVFAWTGSGTDQLVPGEVGKDGKLAFTFRPGLGADVPLPKARAYAVPKDVTVELVRAKVELPVEPPEVRKLDANEDHFAEVKNTTPTAAEVKSADELAKAKAFSGDEGREALKKQVDFAKEKLVLFVWEGSRSDKLNYSGPDDKGRPVFTYKRGGGDDVPRTRAFAFAVPKDVAVELVSDPPVRALDLSALHFQRPDNAIPKLIEVKSADELAKAAVFRDDEARAAAKKQIDFAKEKLVVFLWKGSSTDKVSYEGRDEKKNLVFAFKSGRGDDLPQPWVNVYAVPKDVAVEFKDKSSKERPVSKVEDEDGLVRFVEETGGFVTRDLGKPGKPVTRVTHQSITDGELKQLAVLKSLVDLDLVSGKVTDAGLKELPAFDTLTHLTLSSAKVTDTGLKELARQENLVYLKISSEKVTGAGLKELAGLDKLTHLDLSECEQVTDVGLKEIAGLKNLTFLNLSGCEGVTDAGLKELAGLQELKSLYLGSTKMTNTGLAHLAGLTNLTHLSLPVDAPITDEGLVHLAGLKKLTSLNLSGTKVTGKGLKHLAGLKGLTTLDLYTVVTDEILRELHQLGMLHCLVQAQTAVGGVRPTKDEEITSLQLTRARLDGDGLKYVAKLKNLARLDLQDAKVNDALLEELQRTLPNCKVTR